MHNLQRDLIAELRKLVKDGYRSNGGPCPETYCLICAFFVAKSRVRKQLNFTLPSEFLLTEVWTELSRLVSSPILMAWTRAHSKEEALELLDRLEANFNG